LNSIPSDIKEFLDEKALQYNAPVFIETDPVSIPHGFDRKEDIEISGFLTATIAWGNRTMILKNANKMMELMDNSPLEFVLSHRANDLKRFKGFVHRTFNEKDLTYFIESLKNIYANLGGLEPLFSGHCSETSTRPAIQEFRNRFFALLHDQRTTKHVANPAEGSAAKRINMFLRWMVRCDNRGVDFGLWKRISPSQLSCPLDVHSGNVARKLGLLTRRQNDAKAVDELDAHLRLMDPADPVKYDFALFGLGVFEGF
jgi:uncharacterized protein (TIGR02757 family)